MPKGPSLTDEEKRIVKALSDSDERNQDIHVLINIGRTPTVNFGRLSGIADWDIEPASEDEVAKFRFEKSLTDLRTGLSPFTDERLVRSREAMLLAVQLFNNPLLNFKVEVFAVLANIAWTYLLHEFYVRKGVQIEDEQGHSLLLSQMIARDDCPLKPDVIKNLGAMKILRDEVEHKVLGSLGRSFYTLFQSNCLNFEVAICELFGEQLSLGDQLTYSLQFSKLAIEQIEVLQKYDINPAIQAIDEKISGELGLTGKEGAGYQFKVSYSLQKSPKGGANFVFTTTNPQSANTHNVVMEKVPADELWPYKPRAVIDLVREATGSDFNGHHHTLAWKKTGVRPPHKSDKPKSTKKEFCTFHTAHGDYTYSQAWVDLLIQIAGDQDEFNKLKAYKPKQ
ncbi:DUF3644 domain-containing protein [Parasphingopyxis algicola]|uniref:DUF3644 domain-containing protein n=1 Tax=Parasphingopyxis algicola TaxID=2026624 RepID=UPI0015A4B3A9|nr:DUF3644 domain-containing protein [Parasphingopyxis algicola]QLC25734.1 DUF3644 domain-containing protein [Parasphingopyxis algicola]